MRQDMPRRCVVPLFHARDVRSGHREPHVHMLCEHHWRVLGWDRLHNVRHKLRRFKVRAGMSWGSNHGNHLLGPRNVHGWCVYRHVHLQRGVHLRNIVQSYGLLVRRVPLWKVRRRVRVLVPGLPEHL